MNPIRLYFATNSSFMFLKEEGVKNLLFSFAVAPILEKWMKLGDDEEHIIIDSGAFSVWNKGRTIEMDDYIKFCHEQIELGKKLNKHIRVVNLDVIPGKKGETTKLNSVYGNIEKNKEVIEEAAKKGYENLKIMIANGITPIHVYHQGENIKWLDRMVEKTDYIGISPANDVPMIDKKIWVSSVFEHLYKKGYNVKTHGFAVWSPLLLKSFPWTSGDATSWSLLAAYGKIIYPIKSRIKSENGALEYYHFKVFDVSKRRENIADSSHFKELEKDGYSKEFFNSYKNRIRVNIRTYLFLEKWLNEWKENNDYTPTNKLF